MDNNAIDAGLKFSEAPPRINAFRHFIKVFVGRKIVIIGLIIILINAVAAIFAPLLAPYNPNQTYAGDLLEMPSWEHPLGTDTIGRDYLSRMIYGARTSMVIGIGSVVIAAGLGITLGLIAGYSGGW
jgi:peptide/nickel transport system permease protein